MKLKFDGIKEVTVLGGADHAAMAIEAKSRALRAFDVITSDVLADANDVGMAAAMADAIIDLRYAAACRAQALDRSRAGRSVNPDYEGN